MSRNLFVQAHNDNHRDYTLQKIQETIDLLTFYKDALRRVDPTLSDRDRRAILFAIARCADVYRAEIRQSSGILLAVSLYFGGGS